MAIDTRDTTRAIKELEKRISMLERRVGSDHDYRDKPDVNTKTGDMRVTKDSDTYYLEVRTGDGWLRSEESTFSVVSSRNTKTSFVDKDY